MSYVPNHEEALIQIGKTIEGNEPCYEGARIRCVREVIVQVRAIQSSTGA